MENALPDIPRLFTAIAEWGACLVFIMILPKRFSRARTALIGTVTLAIQCLFLVVTGDTDIFYLWILYMIIAVLLMITFIFCSCRISGWEAAYCALQAFILAEFVASLDWQVYCFYFYSSFSVRNAFPLFLFFCVLVYLSYWWLLHRQNSARERLDIRAREVGTVALIAVLIFFVSNLSYIPSYFDFVTPFTSGFGQEAATMRTMMDLSGVAMMYAHYVFRCELRDRAELKVMQGMLESQYQQYQFSKESIDLVHYKYHDLKHQIEWLRKEESPQKREEYLAKMEEEIQQFETQNQTGNKVLDTMLTGRSITCQKNHIELNCVADGKLLDFMDIMDLCALLGNALDNAIECEKKIADPKKRLIHVAIFSQKDFLIMRFENYFEGSLHMDGSTLVSTKDNTGFHGYGIKSIQHTVKKYNGAANIETKDNWFELKILIPLNKAG